MDTTKLWRLGYTGMMEPISIRTYAKIVACDILISSRMKGGKKRERRKENKGL